MPPKRRRRMPKRAPAHRSRVPCSLPRALRKSKTWVITIHQLCFIYTLLIPNSLFLVWLVLGSTVQWGGREGALQWARWFVHSARQLGRSLHLLAELQAEQLCAARAHRAGSGWVAVSRKIFYNTQLNCLSLSLYLSLFLPLSFCLIAGTFSFGSYAKFKSQTITEFIEKAVEHSRSGRCVFHIANMMIHYMYIYLCSVLDICSFCIVDRNTDQCVCN